MFADLAEGNGRFPITLQRHMPTDQAPDPARQTNKVTHKSVSSDFIQELDDIHTALDTAVLNAYNWPHNLTDEQILERLLALNLEQAAKQEKKLLL